MVIGSYDLERLADDVYKDRRITGSVYCSECGYNLHTLPYVYTCPECGNKYNARPLRMHGIFAPHEIIFPFRDIGAFLICALSAGLFGYGAFKTRDVVRMWMALILAAFTVLFAWHAFESIMRFSKATRIARRIALEEPAEEE